MKLTTIAELPFYTEGPAQDANGNLFFTTLTGGIIYRIDTDGRLSEWAQSKCPNGQIILPNGDHLVCDSLLGAIHRFSPQGKLIGHEIEGVCDGVKVNVPNDLIVTKRGTLYFTDSIRHVGSVFYLKKNGEQGVLATGLDYPNGLILSVCEQWLYVAESYQNRILKIDLIQAEIPQVFADLPVNPSGKLEDNLPDGLCIDNEGSLWIAHYGMQALQVISKEGILLNTIDTGLPLTSNVTWISEHILIITGGYGEPGPGRLMKIEL